METYIEAVHCTDDNFQGIEHRFGGRSEVQVVSIDKNGKVQRLRLGGTDSEDAAIAVASVLQASLFSEGVQSLENGGFKAGKTEAKLYNKCADFAAKIMELSSVEEPIPTEEDLDSGKCNNEPDDKANLTIDLTSITHRSTGLLGLELVVSTGSPSSDEKGPLVTVDRSGVAMLEREVREATSQ
jgi:hypothetical protein